MQKQNRLRYALHAISLLILFLMQGTRGLTVEIFGVAPLLLIPFSVCIGMFEHEVAGASFGFAAGLLWDVNAGGWPGFNAIMLMIFGWLCGWLITNLIRNNFLSAFLLTGGSLAVYSVLHWLFFYCLAGYDNAAYAFWHFDAVQAVYSLLCVIPMYFSIRFFMKVMRAL